MKDRAPLMASIVIGIVVALGHTLYLRHLAAAAMAGWADGGPVAADLWGFGPYLRAQDYFLGFSYALGTAFAVWAVWRCIRARTAVAAVGAAGSVTFIGVLLAAGCFLIGCCGSPMLAVYAGLFGAKMLGAGKPLMALITLVFVGIGYWSLSRKLARGAACACCTPQPRAKV
jgi:hypothetical protein